MRCSHLLSLLSLLVLGTVADAAEQLPLVPWPAEVRQSGSAPVRFRAEKGIRCTDASLKPAVAMLTMEFKAGLGVNFASTSRTDAALTVNLDPTLREEEYVLTTGTRCAIRAGSSIAAAWAESTLFQLLKPGAAGITVPKVEIHDHPRYYYRGALVDVARKYHTADGLKQVIQLCWLYKVRFLQLHLTDDQLFMFPSASLPQLGRSNREFARFEPASAPHIRPYTLDELRDLDSFASEHGVALVPEVEMPGHSGRLIADAPELFAIPGNGSTLNIASAKAVTAIKTLLGEVIDVFKSSPIVHIGADEVSLDGLDRTPEFAARKLVEPDITPHTLYCQFISDVQRYARAHGKTTAVWEEAWDTHSKYPLERDTLIMCWSLGRNPAEVAASGYRVINAGWTPLYIVRDNRKTPEFLYKWRVDEFGREGSEQFTDFNKQVAGGEERLAGLQLCSWENSESIEIQSLRQRLAISAERGWSGTSPGDYASFLQRFASTDACLEGLTQSVHISLNGGGNLGENVFTAPLAVNLKSQVLPAGQRIRYALDNSLPGPTWKDYSLPLSLEKTAWLRAGVFDAAGKQHGPLTGAWLKCEIVPRPNLATNKAVTVGPSPDRKDGWFARLAVDGKRDDAMAHWAPDGPAPQWLMVDMQKVQPINTINVVTYWDGGRYYQWTAEASVDGKTWRTVADFSKNSQIATEAGYQAKFSTVPARYVRINMLKNSANPFVHIVELIVDLKK